jgi:hypothetical protein
MVFAILNFSCLHFYTCWNKIEYPVTAFSLLKICNSRVACTFTTFYMYSLQKIEKF